MAAATAAVVPELLVHDQSPRKVDTSIQEHTMDFDELSGRTIPQPGPWKQMLSDRRRAKQVYQQASQAPGKPHGFSRAPPVPKLPESDYKIVYRPRDGLRLAAWSDRQITAGIQTASRIPEGSFNQQIVIQVQAVQNLIVASTPNDEYAEILSEVTSLQLGAATYNILPYIKPFPGTVRGVIHGLDVGTTTEQLPYIIASSGPRIVQARMLGKSTSAVVTFEGPHVPFYIRAHGLHTRCRPYRRSIQCCTLCGDIGHRRDVCPTPDVSVCAQCHERDPPPEHACTPKCKLCGLDHPTASRECRKKLRPPPPPLHVRERFSQTLPVYQRHPQHQSPAHHRAPQQQVQAPNSRQHCTPHQVSWSSVVAPTAAPPEDFPALPAQQASKQDNHPRIQKLEAENEQLKKQLDAQTARTEKLERRIEELLRNLEALTQAPTQKSVPDLPTPQPMQQAPSLATLENMSKLEKLIYDLGRKMDNRITALEKRLEANEAVKRKSRKSQMPQTSSNPPSTIPSDNEWESG